VLEKMTIT